MEYEDRGLMRRGRATMDVETTALGSATDAMRAIFDSYGVEYSVLGPYTTYVRGDDGISLKMSDMFNGTVSVEFEMTMEPPKALFVVLKHFPFTRVDVMCNDEGVGHATCTSCGGRVEPCHVYCPSCGAMILRDETVEGGSNGD